MSTLYHPLLHPLCLPYTPSPPHPLKSTLYPFPTSTTHVMPHPFPRHLFVSTLCPHLRPVAMATLGSQFLPERSAHIQRGLYIYIIYIHILYTYTAYIHVHSIYIYTYAHIYSIYMYTLYTYIPHVHIYALYTYMCYIYTYTLYTHIYNFVGVCCWLVGWFGGWRQSHAVAQASLDLTAVLLSLLPSAGITGMCHHV